MKEPLQIRTPGALLRPWRNDDASLLARHADNPRIAACMRDLFPSPYTINDARRFIARATGPSPGLLLAIEVQGKAAGGIGINRSTTHTGGPQRSGTGLPSRSGETAS